MYAVTVRMGAIAKRLLFESLSIWIGRTQENDVVLDGSRVSKRHAQIVFNENRITIIDLNSANGVFVNGKRLTKPQDIIVGDEIRIAAFVLAIEATNISTEVERVQTDSFMSYLPTLASLRRFIGRVLIMDTDFDAFCLDHFESIRRRFSQGMDRVSKTSILLELGDRNLILYHLREDFLEDFTRHQDVLVYEDAKMINKVITEWR